MIKSKAFRVCMMATISAAVSGQAALAQCGTASWYHEGTRTANGEKYKPDGLTAAHRSLPFGTRVKVTHKRTGRSVIVRINDRGPFIRGRIVDLSRGAKRVIGMDGLASVCLTVLGRGDSYSSVKNERRKRVAKNRQRDAGAVHSKTAMSTKEQQRRAERQSLDTSQLRGFGGQLGSSFNVFEWPATGDNS